MGNMDYDLRSVQEARDLARLGKIATQQIAHYSDEQIDKILRNMVRAVVGTLIEVGRGRITVDEFSRIVEGRNRSAAGEGMPGNALFLEDIRY